MTRPYIPLLALVAALAAGCGAEDDGAIDSMDLDEEGPSPDALGKSVNGKSLNGPTLNGTTLNGKSLNGKSLNGAGYGGVTLSGSSVTNVTLNATVFSGTKGGSTISGAGFVGTTWQGQLSDGSTFALRIDSRTQLAAPNADLYAYGVSYQTTAGWSPLCGSAATLAIPLAGVWNYGEGVAGGGSWTADATRFTFACRATAIAKCVELGYKPWKVVGGVNLQNHLVACTRALRADVCGDGKSWTVDGTQINIYDAKGVQADTEAWTIEADWTAAGARFISSAANTRFKAKFTSLPACFSSKVSPLSCGNAANFSTGTLIMNEYLQ
jgi:hypothetical protein